MGNHEFCSQCGDSVFHYNNSCVGTERWKEYKAQEKLDQESYQRRCQKAQHMLENFRDHHGYDCHIENGTKIVIYVK